MTERPFQLTAQPPLKEEAVVEACLDLLAHHRYWYAKLHAGRYRTPDLKRWITGVATGTPDYVCMRGPHGFLIEFKRPGGKPTPMQMIMAGQLRAVNELTVVVIDSVEMMSMWLAEFERKLAAG